MFDHVKPYKLPVMIMLSGIVISEGVYLVVPMFYKRFFDVIAGEVVLTGTTVSDQLINTIFIILILNGICWASWRMVALLNNKLQPRIMADLTQTAQAYLHKHSYRFFNNMFTGSLVKRVNRLSRAFENLTDQVSFKFLPLAVVLTGYLIVLYGRHPGLAGILAVWLIVFLAFNIGFAMWKIKYDAEKAELDSKATAVLADGITNAVTVKLFTGFDDEIGRYKKVTEKLRKMRTFTWNLGEVVDATQAGLMVLIEFGLMYFAIQLWQKGVLTIGDFALIQSYLIVMFGKLWDIGRSVRYMYEAFANADEMVQVLDTPLEVTDRRNAKELDVQTGRIVFENVYFSFHKTRRVLKGLDLEIKAGEKIALVGSSGAGKTTIVKLLMRLYDVERGKIIVGNQRIDRVTQDSLRSQITMVPQDPILFHRSIMDNIRYGLRDATDEEVMEAAKKARCHEFIMELPDAYETYVGERGVKLSGGERQRVAIARAILKNAPILILDEATSSLDSESEALIQEALDELMSEKTTIVIAHRLSTIMKMDRILEIEDGKVLHSGTHKQLLRRKNGMYRNLWEIQAGGFM